MPVDVAGKLAGDNPDYSIQDLYEAIEKKDYVCHQHSYMYRNFHQQNSSIIINFIVSIFVMAQINTVTLVTKTCNFYKGVQLKIIP